MEMFNEICILLVAYFMRSLLNLDDDIKYNYGWVYVAIIGTNLLVNLVLILHGMFTVSIPDLY
jgi:hypothetical protein